MPWKRDVIYGFCTVLFALFMLYQTALIPELGDVKSIAGARVYLFPWFILMLLLGINLVFQGCLQKRQLSGKIQKEISEDQKEEKKRFLPLSTFFTLAVLFLYFLLIPVTGYQVATVLFLLVLFTGYFLFCQEERFRYIIKYKKQFAVLSAKYLFLSIAVVLFIQIVFGEILNVRLPG